MPREADDILVAGLACRLPDATDPSTLFSNSLEGRLSFRQIPPERLALDDYEVSAIGQADSITPIPAGLLDDWTFDRARFGVPLNVFEGADLTHWLALEVAADAIEAACGADRLDRDGTAVVVANTLTGEFSRAAALRLRWPWLDRQLAAALAAAGACENEARAARAGFRDRLRVKLREPDEESLAGGLSNTIAGRIANHFDLHGGAFCVDGACASSLVAVATAADLIRSGAVGAVVVVGVDLSLDPFELVGFSRNGALASERMRVFDARAQGFWPGEGAAAIMLMSETAASRVGVEALVRLAGWGISTDGSGGLTRPSVDGQRRAIERAYRRASVDPNRLGYVEAHGTGTAIGDPTEIRGLAAILARRKSAVPIGSVKANIGHTKAAAGLAGFVRAARALIEETIPPHSGCERPNPAFAETGDRLRVATGTEEWPEGTLRVAGVSSFGFGGINAHVVLTSPGRRLCRPMIRTPENRDAELFLFRGAEPAEIRDALGRLSNAAAHCSFSEVTDAAAHAAGALRPGSCSLAFQASSPAELHLRIGQALGAVDGSPQPQIKYRRSECAPRIGYVFPGQGAPVRPGRGAWGSRFAELPGISVSKAAAGGTSDAQPAIASASLAGLVLLDTLDLTGACAIGHSLGELAALTWAGSIGRDALVPLAEARGRIMGALAPGAMLQLRCDAAEAVSLADGLALSVACLNRSDETILSGDFADIEALESRAREARIASFRLDVSHAFHSPQMASAIPQFEKVLRAVAVSPPARPVASTVTGGWLSADCDVRALLLRQLTEPVRFTSAAEKFLTSIDVAVEIGPGSGLTRLLSGAGVPIASLDVFSDVQTPLLDALALVFSCGAELAPDRLFAGLGVRPPRAAPPLLLSNPCGVADGGPVTPAPPAAAPAPAVDMTPSDATDILSSIIEFVARETGIPAEAVSPDRTFLQLKIGSTKVSLFIPKLAAARGLTVPGLPTDFAGMTLRGAAEELGRPDIGGPRQGFCRVSGPGRWVRHFHVATAPLDSQPKEKLSWHRANLRSRRLKAADGLLIDMAGPWEAARDARELVRLCRSACGRYNHLAIVHRAAPLSGFARSIAAERLFESVRLIDHAPGPDLLDRRVRGFEEVIRLPDGTLAKPTLELYHRDGPFARPDGAILVTGGARGIAAECAIHLAGRMGVPLVLVGRSPAAHPDVETTLRRLEATGIRSRYIACDVCDSDRLFAAVQAASEKTGPITHLVHAAGTNVPAPLSEVDGDLLAGTLAPKTTGLEAAVAACGQPLRRVVAFSSIIGRLGLAGEAHYALANAEQSRLLAEIANRIPGLSALAIEWSVWGGAGMGERLGSLDRLDADGVDALLLDEALDVFEQLLLGGAEGVLVTASRYGENAPIGLSHRLRFAQQCLVHTPRVELVLETTLDEGRDPYLNDHRFDGSLIFPGVMMLEAMCQARAGLAATPCRSFSDVRFDQRIVVPRGGQAIRIGALLEIDGTTVADVRSGEDCFAAPCARARLHDGAEPAPALPPPLVAGHPAAPLYGSLFFQDGRFRRLVDISSVSSRTVSASLSPRTEAWFGPYEPTALLLGDPGARDAALHALQCCVPHRRLLPVAVGRIDRFEAGAPARMSGTERWTRKDDYAFDILLLDAAGAVVEHWQEAVFHAVDATDLFSVLETAPWLRGPFVERAARERTGDDSLAIALVDDSEAGRSGRRERVAAALGISQPILSRADGKPLSVRGESISFAHSGGITLGARSLRPIGCDIENLAMFETEEAAASWTAEETLRKIGSRAALQRADGLYTGQAGERIAAIGPIPANRSGRLMVAVGVGER